MGQAAAPIPRGCLTASTKPCVPPGARFTLSTTKLAVGESVTVSGNACPPGNSASTDLGPSDIATAGSDGTWSATVTIQPGYYGPGTVYAACGALFAYPNTFAVTFSTPYHLDVLPSTTVSPGQTLTVESVGSFCSSIDTIYVGVSPEPDPSYFFDDESWPVPLQVSDTDSSGAPQVVYPDPWHTTITVPSWLAAGRYYVVAGCAYSRAYPGIYQPSRITVT